MTTSFVFVSVWHSSSFCVRVFDWRCNQIALYFSARCVYLTPDHALCVSCLYVCVCVCEHLVLLSSALCVYLTLDFIFCVSCIYVCAFVYCVCKHLVLISSALCVYLTCDRLFFYCMWECSWLPYSTYLHLDFHLFLFVFHDKAKRTQQGNLLVSMLHCSWLYVHVCYCVCEHLVLLGSVCLVDPGPHPLSHRAPPSGEFIRRSVRWTRDWKQFAFSTKRLWWETRYSWTTSLDPNVLADIQK